MALPKHSNTSLWGHNYSNHHTPLPGSPQACSLITKWRCIYSNFRSLPSLQQSQPSLNVPSQVFPETHAISSLPCIKMQIMYIQHAVMQGLSYSSQREHSKEMLDQSTTRNPSGQTPNSATPCLMSATLPLTPCSKWGQDPLQNSNSLVDCNTRLFLGLVPLPVSSSPWQVSHGSGIPNI